MAEKHPDEILAGLHNMATRLYEAYRNNTSDPQLTEDLLGYFKHLKYERQHDGTVTLKTPSLMATNHVDAWAEVTNRGLYYLAGMDLDPRTDVRQAHSDIIKDLSLTAISKDIFGSIVPRASDNHEPRYDHIVFNITPEKIANAHAHLPDDHRREIGLKLLQALVSGPPQSYTPSPVGMKPQAM